MAHGRLTNIRAQCPIQFVSPEGFKQAHSQGRLAKIWLNNILRWRWCHGCEDYGQKRDSTDHGNLEGHIVNLSVSRAIGSTPAKHLTYASKKASNYNSKRVEEARTQKSGLFLSLLIEGTAGGVMVVCGTTWLYARIAWLRALRCTYCNSDT